jgi:hypothetical protein
VGRSKAEWDKADRSTLLGRVAARSIVVRNHTGRAKEVHKEVSKVTTAEVLCDNY